MVKRNAIATKLTKICTQTQKRAFDVAVYGKVSVSCTEKGLHSKVEAIFNPF